MWRLFVLCCGMFLASAAAFSQTSNSASIAENLCVSDSISIQPRAGSLQDGTHSVLLSWDPEGADWYRVYRGSTSGGPYAVIADCVTATGYTDASVANGQTYFYVLTAVLAGTESDQSGEISSTIPVFDAVAIVKNVNGNFLALTQALTTSDSILDRQTLRRGPGETLATSDALTRQANHFRSAQEILNTSASLSATVLGPSDVTLYEDLTTGDNLARTAVRSLALSETLSGTDSVTVRKEGNGSILFPRNGRPPEIFLLGSNGVAPAGGCGFLLQVFGRNFSAFSVVSWNGTPRQTTYLSPTLLSAEIGSEDLTTPGAFPVRIQSSTLPPVVSNSKTFTVVGANPSLASVHRVGSMVVVDGSNFADRTSILWNGEPLSTTWVSYTRLQAPLPAHTQAIGTNVVSVANPAGCP